MKLFVGNLPYDVTDEALQEIFEKIGSVVSAKVVFDRVTSRSKGFGFIEMSNQTDGEKAIEELDGVEVSGRSIVVKKAEEKPRRERTGGFGGGGNDRGGYDRSDRGGDRRRERR